MKKLLLFAILPCTVLAQNTRSSTEKALDTLYALRTQTSCVAGVLADEYDDMLNSVQTAISCADQALDGQLSAGIRVTLHQQLSLYQQLTPAYLNSLDRIDAKNLQQQLDALTAKLTTLSAQDTNQALPLTTLAHIRLANSYLHTLLNPVRFKRPSSWKKLTRGLGGNASAALPLAAAATGAVLATGACFLYTIDNGPGNKRYLLRRECDGTELAEQHSMLHQVAQAVEAVELGGFGADFMADKAERLLAGEMGTRARVMVQEHTQRLVHCLRQDVLLCEQELHALEKYISDEIATSQGVSEGIIRAGYRDDKQRLERDKKLAEQRVTTLQERDPREALADRMDAIGVAHMESKDSDLTHRRPSTTQQILALFKTYYPAATEPVRASYIYDIMVYNLLVGTRGFTGFIEQARTFISSLSETQRATPLVTAIQSYLGDYKVHEPATTERALITLHQFVTETGPALVRS